MYSWQPRVRQAKVVPSSWLRHDAHLEREAELDTMTTEGRRDRERKRIRAAFLDAARALLVAEGYEALTMRKVAERAEYSPAAIYTHFLDKEALVKELCANDFSIFTAS